MNNASKIASYDLTTIAGLTKAISDYAKENPKIAVGLGALLAATPLAPFGYVASMVAKAFEESSAIDEQRKAAIDIIKSGKENGVSKIRVTLDQKAGVDIGAELQGYPLKFAVGRDNQMTIEVEYK